MQVNRTLGFCKFIDKEHENAESILADIFILLQKSVNNGLDFSLLKKVCLPFCSLLNILKAKCCTGHKKKTIIQS